MLLLRNKFIYGLPILLPASPALAHNVQIEGNVAATFHIEPNHNPKAGEPAKAWFALTKAGGEVIALDRCDCQLTVRSNNQTIAQPALQAISAEQYKGIPGADITFPKAGIYTLEISGKPKTGSEFNAFKLAYDVTVQAGIAPSPTAGASAPVVAQPAEFGAGWIFLIALGAIALGVGAWIVRRTVKN